VKTIKTLRLLVLSAALLALSACSGSQPDSPTFPSTSESTAVAAGMEWDALLYGDNDQEGFISRVTKKYGTGSFSAAHVIVERNEDKTLSRVTVGDGGLTLTVFPPHDYISQYDVFYYTAADKCVSTIVGVDNASCDYAADQDDADTRTQTALTLFRSVQEAALR